MVASDADISKPDGTDEEVVRRMLEVVSRNATITQRSLASELGIALGLTNSYLRRCVRKGLIKISQVPPRRYAYYLTPKGFAEKSRLTATYLTDSFSLYRKARGQCTELLQAARERGQNRIALIGEGDLADIARLLADDMQVEVVATIAATHDAERLSEVLAGLGRIDAVMLTSLVDPAAAFAAAVAKLGPERVYVPSLLGIKRIAG